MNVKIIQNNWEDPTCYTSHLASKPYKILIRWLIKRIGLQEMNVGELWNKLVEYSAERRLSRRTRLGFFLLPHILTLCHLLRSHISLSVSLFICYHQSSVVSLLHWICMDNLSLQMTKMNIDIIYSYHTIKKATTLES